MPAQQNLRYPLFSHAIGSKLKPAPHSISNCLQARRAMLLCPLVLLVPEHVQHDFCRRVLDERDGIPQVVTLSYQGARTAPE